MQDLYINQLLRISYLAQHKHQNSQVKPTMIQSAGKHTKAKSLSPIETSLHKFKMVQ